MNITNNFHVNTQGLNSSPYLLSPNKSLRSSQQLHYMHPGLCKDCCCLWCPLHLIPNLQPQQQPLSNLYPLHLLTLVLTIYPHLDKLYCNIIPLDIPFIIAVLTQEKIYTIFSGIIIVYLTSLNCILHPSASLFSLHLGRTLHPIIWNYSCGTFHNSSSS